MHTDKADPFDKEKQTIEALLSQWEEEDIPETELSIPKPMQELPCFNSTVIEETKQIFQPVTAVPVRMATLPQDSESIIVELGCQKLDMTMPQNVVSLPTVASPMTTLPREVAAASQNVTTLPVPATNDVVMADIDGHVESHGELPKSGRFLPVEGGYIIVEENEEPGNLFLFTTFCRQFLPHIRIKSSGTTTISHTIFKVKDFNKSNFIRKLQLLIL